MTRTTALISHPNSLLHQISQHHPERPERITAIESILKHHGLYDLLIHHQARQATRAQLIAVHDAHYVDQLFSSAPKSQEQRVQIDGDTAMNFYSLAAALTASGAVMDGVDGVMNQDYENAFCLVRPPGHHAEHGTAMGFCFFDNVAVGAQYVMDKYGLTRIAIVDFDVHHGNGTEDIFLDESRVLFCSTFQHSIFPGKFATTQPGHIINVPLSHGCDGPSYQRIFSESVLPQLDEFEPEFIFISAGFDAHKNDSLASIDLEADDFAWITRQIMQVADKHAKGRLVSTLEGGYDLDGLANSAYEHIRVLAGQP